MSSNFQKFWYNPVTQWTFWIVISLAIAGCIAVVIVMILLLTGVILPAGGSVTPPIVTSTSTSTSTSGLGGVFMMKRPTFEKSKPQEFLNSFINKTTPKNAPAKPKENNATQSEEQPIQLSAAKKKKSKSPVQSTTPTTKLMNENKPEVQKHIVEEIKTEVKSSPSFQLSPLSKKKKASVVKN